MERKPQIYANHTKFDPSFHFVLVPLLLILTIGAIRAALIEGTGEAWWRVGLATAVFLLAGKARLFSLKVQDRVIRLEERLRMERILPDSLKSRISELTESQIIGLRFACDTELPAAVEKALGQRLSNKQIKQTVQTWRPDYFRV